MIFVKILKMRIAQAIVQFQFKQVLYNQISQNGQIVSVFIYGECFSSCRP